jgi:hypothetical protein
MVDDLMRLLARLVGRKVESLDARVAQPAQA